MTDAGPEPLPAGTPPADAPATSPPPPARAEAAVLARGHLHPAILILRLFDVLRQVGFLLVVGLVVERWFLVVALVAFLLQLGYAVARYLTLEYTLTADELRVREGILERQERRIPLDRIQDLGLESTLLRRALGLTVVLVETASGRGVEARLDALSRADADHLRDVLLAARSERLAAAPATASAAADGVADAGGAPAALPAPAPEPEWLVHQSRAGELFVRGLTDLRLGGFVITGFAAIELLDQLGFAARIAGVVDSAQDWVTQFPPVVTVAILIGVVVLVLGFGVVTATLGNLVQFHGFVLVLRGDVLQRRYGLLTTRQKTLPRARIQRVTVEQPWLRRLLGVASVKADSAGGSRTQGEDTSGGWDVVVPLTRLPDADALLPALLPGLESQAFAWQRGSRRLIARLALQGVVLALLAGAAALGAGAGTGIALAALLFVPLWALLGLLTWINLGFALGGPFLALRHGIVGRHLAYVPTARVQAVVVGQGPFAQLLGLADLTVYVMGGSPTRLPDLTLADARQLAHAIAERAAIAAAAEW
ncbi:MAG: PH domain-containing protein [Planctomycetes bacterium]|nr:PH domain-containing protein [Planctomycetota bacterium]